MLCKKNRSCVYAGVRVGVWFALRSATVIPFDVKSGVMQLRGRCAFRDLWSTKIASNFILFILLLNEIYMHHSVKLSLAAVALF